MLQIIVKNNNNDLNKLFTALRSIINKYLPEASVELEIAKKYWKWEGHDEIILHVYNINKSIFVRDIMPIFNISWTYSEDPVFDIDLQQEKNLESGFWNKINHSTEVFLFPDAEWVHVYSW